MGCLLGFLNTMEFRGTSFLMPVMLMRGSQPVLPAKAVKKEYEQLSGHAYTTRHVFRTLPDESTMIRGIRGLMRVVTS